MLLGIIPFVYTFFGEISYHAIFWTKLYKNKFNVINEYDILLNIDRNNLNIIDDHKKYIDIFNTKYNFYNNKPIVIIYNSNLNIEKNKLHYQNIINNSKNKKKKKNKLALLIRRFRKTQEDDAVNWYNSRLWYTKMKYTNNIEDVNIKSHDNLTLHGSLIKNNIDNNNNFVIIAHGYGGNYYCHIDIAYGFYKYLGCNVLLINQRSYGNSEGDYTSLGWKESIDIYRWIHYIVKNYPNANIILWGISMGGASVLLTSSMKLPKNVKLCISDCAFNNFVDLCKEIIKKTKLTKLIFYPIIHSMITSSRLHNTYINFSIKNYIKNTKIPILFIHGISDELINFKHAITLFKSYPNDKRLLLVKYADHCKASIYAQDLYWSTIYDFAKNYITF